MTTKITRINKIAQVKPNEVFTSIYQIIDYDLLLECFNELDKNKAVGLDKVTKDVYRADLNNNLTKLVNKLKNMSYKPQPARRVNIPKANGKIRELAIANFEDKIVQLAFKKLIEAIYEPKFTNNMFGFRPNKSCHDCLRYIGYCVEKRKVRYILDADIKGYFDNINHDLIIRGLEAYIKDKRVIRIIKRFLKAGIMQNGVLIINEQGTPQGSILSPVLANIVMYYGIILFVERIKKRLRGYIEIINYADDMILCFQYKYEAIQIYNFLTRRLNKIGLEFADDKTKLIEFGKWSLSRNKRNSFDFLGFTHYCSTSVDGIRFRVKRRTSKKKLRQKIVEYKIWIKTNRHLPLKQIMGTTRRKLIGHYNYYGVTDNFIGINRYYKEVMKILFKWLNRRSQKKSYTYETFDSMLKAYQIPKPHIKVKTYARRK